MYELITDRAALESWRGAYRTAPVAARLAGCLRTPAEVFLACKNVSRHCFLLESAEQTGADGRYTLIGYDPTLELTCKDGRLTVRAGADFTTEVATPAPAIAKIIADNAGPRVAGLPPFTGGLAGYFAFDYLAYGEPTLRRDADDEDGFRDVDLMLFDKVIAFDHATHELFLIVTIKLDALAENYNRALAELDAMARLVTEGRGAELPELRLTGPYDVLFDRAQFTALVARAQRHITDGDIFQVVLSNRLRAPAEGSLFQAYERLRQTNPSPYMFYFASDDLELAGASPETLVRLVGDEVTTFPLAGTRPRGHTAEEDEQLEAGLLADAKELAEHNMLVDLGRNDIGKIAQLGTVAVVDYLNVLRFSHVMHLGSVVQGRVRDDVTAVDAINAVLPAGTLSGAPKIRACQIINDLEGVKRGVYGGAIGYIATSGDMDTCISIRLAYKKAGHVLVRSGAGIVADSHPDTEFDETIAKARAVVEALPEVAA
ncbi:MAG: anthranilate synthase component I family protein [Propionibacteriaceae bacterium]|nr:anthranilate synthase component I family protein [Propionibacteriaceae bacterium]